MYASDFGQDKDYRLKQLIFKTSSNRIVINVSSYRNRLESNISS